MKNFRPLDKDEYEQVWDKFYDLFDFKPSTTNFPAIKTISQQLKLNISDCFSADYPFDKLEQWALTLFCRISNSDERLYALDWQHEFYDFDPRQEIDKDEFDEWTVPVFPNGNYYIFLTKDFKNVWFGHPWEQIITLIGNGGVICGG